MQLLSEPFITGGTSCRFSGTSYYVGAKVITGNPFRSKRIEIVYVNTATNNYF